MSHAIESALVAVRPVILIEGEELAGLNRDFLGFVIEERLNGISCCGVRFTNVGQTEAVDYPYLDLRTLHFGKRIEVMVNDGEPLFVGRIVALEAVYPSDRPPELLVLAEDRLTDLQTTRRYRTFENMSEADVIQQIATTHSLQPDIQSGALTNIQPVIAQVDQTDLDFLCQQANRYGVELWVDDDTLYVRDRAHRNGGNLSLTYGQQLLSFQAQASLANQVSQLRVSGWDVSSKTAIEETVNGHVIESEITGTSGSTFLVSRFGPRTQHLTKATPINAEHAQMLAIAAYRANARRFVTGVGRAQGNAGIRVSTNLNIDNLGGLFSGRYYVTHVCHKFDGSRGFDTEFEVERADLMVTESARPRRPVRGRSDSESKSVAKNRKISLKKKSSASKKQGRNSRHNRSG